MRTSLPSYQSLSESKDTLDWGGWGGRREELPGQSVKIGLFNFHLPKSYLKMDINNELVQSHVWCFYGVVSTCIFVSMSFFEMLCLLLYSCSCLL